MDQGIRQWLVGVNYKISNANTCCVGAMRNPQPSKNDEHPKLSQGTQQQNAPTTTTNERGGRDWREQLNSQRNIKFETEMFLLCALYSIGIWQLDRGRGHDRIWIVKNREVQRFQLRSNRRYMESLRHTYKFLHYAP